MNSYILLLTAPFRYLYACLRFSLSGQRLCTEDQVRERFALCQSCPEYRPDGFPKGCDGTPGVCDACICCISASMDPEVKNKLRYPTERCPLPEPRWKEV